MIDVIEWVGLLSLPFFLVLDLVHRAQPYRAARGWRVRALAVTVFTFFATTAIADWFGALLPGATLFDGAALGTWAGAGVGILVYELAHYLYHRAVHRFDVLWRGLHQMHHSAESLDAFGASWIHPLDLAMFTILPVAVLVPLLGLAPESIAIVAAFIAFNAAFQHANIRTPRWVGYLVQRPESHSVHHQKGVHRYNYSDLPLWDMVFGTFRNPRDFAPEVGLHHGASARVPEMLVGRDVSRPRAAGRPAEPSAAPAARLAATRRVS